MTFVRCSCTRQAGPLDRAEADVRATVDRLVILAGYFAGNAGAALTECDTRAVDRLLIDTLASARAVEAAWDANFREGGQ